MNLFSFQKLSSATCAIILSMSLGVSSAHAFGESCNNLTRQMQSDIKKNSQNNSVMGTRIVMSDRQCRNGYSRMDAKELWEGGCFSKTSPFEPCRTSIPDWTSLQSNTNRDCLNIWGAMALNSRGEDFVVYGENTYRIIQAQYAYHLSRNNLYMNTLDGLDQAEMNKVASSVTEPWK